MDIHDAFNVGPNSGTGRWTKCDVGHEMTVHNIDVNPIGPLGFDRFAFSTKIGEVGGEDRWGYFEGAIECHSVPFCVDSCGYFSWLALGASGGRLLGKMKGAALVRYTL